VVEGDAVRLNQILLNLTSNALKFTEEGHVKVGAQKVEQKDKQIKLRFTVEDTGIGISSEKLKKIFKSFQQAEQDTSHKYGGTGLVLAI
jgi:signal transduction histidine kinase